MSAHVVTPESATEDFQQFQQRRRVRREAALTLGAAGGAVLATSARPARADVVADITAMVSSLGGITTAVVAVVIAGITVRLAIKFVNRLTVKG
jgi:hypothetical protein